MSVKQHVAGQLARQAAKTIKKLQETQSADKHDRLAALEAEVSHHAAGTGEGALFQLCVLIGEIEAVLGIAEAVSEEAQERGRAIDRLLKALLEWLERETGVWRTDLGFEWYVPRELVASEPLS